jgi:hypothetical protein
MSNGLADLSGTQRFKLDVPGQATAGTVDEFAGIVMPFNAKVVAVSYTPKSTLTGAATNNCTVTVRNRGAAGAGTVQPAQLNFANTVNAAAFVATALPLSATATDLLLNAGDVLTVEKLNVGTGLAMPAGTITVDVQVR